MSNLHLNTIFCDLKIPFLKRLAYAVFLSTGCFSQAYAAPVGFVKCNTIMPMGSSGAWCLDISSSPRNTAAPITAAPITAAPIISAPIITTPIIATPITAVSYVQDRVTQYIDVPQISVSRSETFVNQRVLTNQMSLTSENAPDVISALLVSEPTRAQIPALQLVTVDENGTIGSDNGVIIEAVNANTVQIEANTLGVSGNNAAITVNASDIQDNSAAITVNASDIQGNSDAITVNASDIQDNNAAITVNTSDIQGNSAAIVGNTSNIQNNSGAIAVNASGIQDNSGAIAVNTSGIQNNSGAIATNTAGIADNTTAIEAFVVETHDNSAAIADNTATIITNVSGISTNRQAIAVNTRTVATYSSAISANTSAIIMNTSGVSQNKGDISRNLNLIMQNTGMIKELRHGRAALAAMPDLYLQMDESWATSGGISAYDDGFGGIEYGFGGGVQLRLGDEASHMSFGLLGSVSGDTQAVRLQLRLGG